MPLSQLSVIPDSTADADVLLGALDQCLVAGFARLGSAHRESLGSLARVLGDTALAEPVGRAVAHVVRNPAGEEQVLALAAARESLHGARYDALLGQAMAALGGATISGHSGEATALAEPAALSAPALSLMTSVRQWLHEVALAGLGKLETATVVPFAATLEAVQAQPELGALAVLLTGFVGELADHLPTSAMTELPARSGRPGGPVM